MSSTLSSSSATAHSAQVQMHLEVEGASLSIAQLGPDFLILEHPTEHAATRAEIVLRVDASERRWFVSLPDGLGAATPRTRIARG